MAINIRLRGQIGLLLGMLVLIHFAYPLSEISDAASAVFVVFYCILMGVGAYITGIDRRRRLIAGTMTVLASATGLAWALTSNDRTLNAFLYIFYIILILDLCVIAFTIWEFIFSASAITRDVLLAGVTLYMLIGNIFTPTYFLLNAIIRAATGVDAFAVHTQSAAITWQRMYYLSFTTLTTLGYGDVTPINAFAEPLVTAEAIIGVLFVAVLMARLVSLYDRHRT